jgi:hypothetical protein
MQQKVSLDAHHVDGPPHQSHPHVRAHPNCEVEGVPVDLCQDEHHDGEMVEVGVLERGGTVLRPRLCDLKVEQEHSLQKCAKGE